MVCDKGFLTVPSPALFLLFTWGVYDFTSTMVYEYYPGVREIFFFWGFGTGAVIISFLLAWFCSFMMRVECFRWTHYPVRFDRKNRLVHVFSVDGEVYSAPGTTFSLRLDVIQKTRFKRKNYDIRGHVLAEDRKTVLKTFTLSVSAPRREDLYRNWEFVRRYMEEGPEAVAGVLKLMPPVEGRREGIFFGYWYLMFSATYGAPFF